MKHVVNFNQWDCRICNKWPIRGIEKIWFSIYPSQPEKARNIYILLSHLVHDYMSCFPVLVLLLPIKTSFPELVRHQTCRMGTCLHAAPVDGLGVLIGTCLGTMNEWKAVSNTKKQNSVLFAASDQNIPMLNTRLSLLTRFSTNSKLFKYSETFVILNL